MLEIGRQCGATSPSSRNSLNRGPLLCLLKEVGDIDAASGFAMGSSSIQLTDTELGGSQSMDTEILLSCPAVVPISDDEGNFDDSKDDPDLSADEMLDSEDDAFVDPPCHRIKQRKSADIKLKGAKASLLLSCCKCMHYVKICTSIYFR